MPGTKSPPREARAPARRREESTAGWRRWRPSPPPVREEALRIEGSVLAALDRGCGRLLAPLRPEIRAHLLHLKSQHGLRVDAVDFVCLVFRQVGSEGLAVDQQPLGAPELQRALAMLQAFPASGLVGPRPRAIDVRRPKEVPASASSGLDRI